MSKIWIFVLCVVLISVPVTPTPRIPVSKWPGLTQSPTVPGLEDLRLAIRDLTSKPKTLPSKPRAIPDLADLSAENTDENNDVKDCEKNIVELEAEELNTPKNDTISNNEAILDKKENGNQTKTEIKDKSDGNKCIIEKNNVTDNIKPLPTFIPIFRKRKPKKVKTSHPVELKTAPVELKNENTTSSGKKVNHNRDSVVDYVKNGENRPVLNIIGPKNAVDKGNIRIIPLHLLFANSFPSNVTTASQISNEMPNGITQSPNDGLTSTVLPRNNPIDVAQANILPIETILKNYAAANNVPSNFIITNTHPQNAVVLNKIVTNPVSKNGAPADDIKNINVVPAGFVPVNSNSINFLGEWIPRYSVPENDVTSKPFPRNDIQMNTFAVNNDIPTNIVRENADPINVLSKDFMTVSKTPENNANVVRIKMVPANTIPTNSIPEDAITVSAIPQNTGPVTPENVFHIIAPEKIIAPENVIHIITIPANSIQTNTAPAKAAHKHTVVNTAIPTNTIPASSIVINTAPTVKTVAPNTAPVSVIPKETILSKGITLDAVPRKVEPSTTILSSLTPLNKISASTTNPSSICPVKCTDNNQKADLVLFEPEEVSVLNVCGDILKKVTMTVLVPKFVSKLDL